MKLAHQLLLYTILLSSSVSLAQSPGGVATNLRWWLKANTGVFTNAAKTTAATNGALVEVWADQSGSANDATQATGTLKPTFSTNVINGNPVIFFDNTSNHYLDGTVAPGIGPTESFNAVIVYRLLSYLTDGAIGDGNGTFIFDRPTATNNLMSFKVTNTNRYTYQRREDGGGNLGGPPAATAIDVNNFVNVNFFRNYTTTTEGIYINGKLDVSQTGTAGNVTSPIIRIGRHATDAGHGMHGYFAEIIFHNRTLTAAERQRIDSYIGIKYGLTIDQTSFTNYLRSDGTAIYSPATDATYQGYISDIAGVGQDDVSRLTQTTSASQNTGSVVSMTIIDPATTLVNNEFLVWGSNNGSLTTPNSVDVDGTTARRRLSRVWRAAETGGDVGPTSMSFDLSGVPGALVAGNLRLMVNNASTFATGTTYYTGTLVGSVFTVPSVNLTNGQYFTVGTTNISTTPLPVELTDFSVKYEHPVVIASWKTATELNNDFFTLERAGHALSFNEIAWIPGAGTTNMQKQYTSVDDKPLEGLSYYRLKQTDFDGTSKYGDVKSVNVPYAARTLGVYPNPNDGKFIYLSVPESDITLEFAELLDQTGSLILKTLPLSNKEGDYAINLEEKLKPGLYLIRLRYNKTFYYQKLMVK